MSPILHFEQVGLRYGTGSEMLSNLNFSLTPGGFHIVIGPAGSGKTSLVRLATLAQRPSRGIVRLFGQDVVTLPREALPAIRRRIGTIPQDFRLLPHLTAYENVALPLRIMGTEESALREAVLAMLDHVGLEARRDARPPTLSGGERQRLAIARALVASPELLVADEPTSHLDADATARMVDLLDRVHRAGPTVLMVTRHADLAARLPQAIVAGLGRDGIGDPSGLFRHPAAPRRAYR